MEKKLKLRCGTWELEKGSAVSLYSRKSCKILFVISIIVIYFLGLDFTWYFSSTFFIFINIWLKRPLWRSWKTGFFYVSNKRVNTVLESFSDGKSGLFRKLISYNQIACFIHDELYTFGFLIGVTRKQADLLYYNLSAEENKYFAKVEYWALRLFGEKSYCNNYYEYKTKNAQFAKLGVDLNKIYGDFKRANKELLK